MKDYLEQFYASYTSSADFYEESLKTQVILAFQDWFESSNCIQKDIAQKIGIKPTALSRLLAGKTNMTMKSAAHLFCTRMVNTPLPLQNQRPLTGFLKAKK